MTKVNIEAQEAVLFAALRDEDTRDSMVKKFLEGSTYGSVDFVENNMNSVHVMYALYEADSLQETMRRYKAFAKEREVVRAEEDIEEEEGEEEGGDIEEEEGEV